MVCMYKCVDVEWRNVRLYRSGLAFFFLIENVAVNGFDGKNEKFANFKLSWIFFFKWNRVL